MVTKRDHPYCGRRAVLASMHGKEAALAAPFISELEIELYAAPGIDTDQLGTFSREIARVGSMIDVAERKARLGMAITGCDLGLASEGSFGPHPQIPFLPAGRELLTFIDDGRELRISEALITDTNYAEVRAQTLAELEPFLARIGFPTHAVVVTPARDGRALPEGAPVFKGLQTLSALKRAMATCADASDEAKACVETDMRAHMNPTRLASLSALGLKLAQRLASLCPACSAPGFGRVEIVRGLPCSACGAATEWISHETFGCACCALRETRVREDGLSCTDPSQCPWCNP